MRHRRIFSSLAAGVVAVTLALPRRPWRQGLAAAVVPAVVEPAVELAVAVVPAVVELAVELAVAEPVVVSRPTTPVRCTPIS